MKSKTRVLRTVLVAAAAFALTAALGVQSTAALWTHSELGDQISVSGGSFAGQIAMNGQVVDTTASGNTYKSDNLTLSQANINSIANTGKVAIPLSITTNVTGQLAILPLLSVNARNWSGDSPYIEPSWKLQQLAEGQTCSYSDVSIANFSDGANTLTLNGTGDSNSNPYLVSTYDASASHKYSFCLIGTTPTVACDSGKLGVYAAYRPACGTYSNTGTLTYDKYDGTTDEVQVTDSFNKITEQYDWQAWGNAIDKDVVPADSDKAAVTIMAGYKVVTLDSVPNPDTSSTAISNLPVFESTDTFVAPMITTSSLPAATLGATYDAFFTATGDAVGYTITAGALPDGITLVQETGELSGKPHAVGSSSVTITATNPSGSASKRLTFKVNPVAPIVTVTAGYYHNVYLDSDGRAWSWGRNDIGELGSGIEGDVLTPTEVVGNHRFVAIDSGGYHTLAIDTQGHLWTWGENVKGQLGLGYVSAYVATPTLVSATQTFKAVAANEKHSVALDTSGKLWTWGYNNYGQLGVGDLIDRDTPTAVKPDYSFIAIAAGSYHSLALDTNGHLWGWGHNGSSQLGDLTTTNRLTPVQEASRKVFTSVKAGSGTTMLLDANGKAWAMGVNDSGRLGVGGTTNINTPTAVLGGITFASIEMGYTSSYGIDAAGHLWTWGMNDYGQLGTSTGVKTVPTAVAGTYSVIAAGAYHSVALNSDGKLLASGLNTNGQLGNGAIVNSPSFVFTKPVS